MTGKDPTPDNLDQGEENGGPAEEGGESAGVRDRWGGAAVEEIAQGEDGIGDVDKPPPFGNEGTRSVPEASVKPR